MDEKYVYVLTRVDAEENDHVIGVWDKEEDILPAAKKLFEWCTGVRISGSWLLCSDEGGESEVGYITRCLVQ